MEIIIYLAKFSSRERVATIFCIHVQHFIAFSFIEFVSDDSIHIFNF